MLNEVNIKKAFRSRDLDFANNLKCHREQFSIMGNDEEGEQINEIFPLYKFESFIDSTKKIWSTSQNWYVGPHRKFIS